MYPTEKYMYPTGEFDRTFDALGFGIINVRRRQTNRLMLFMLFSQTFKTSRLCPIVVRFRRMNRAKGT